MEGPGNLSISPTFSSYSSGSSNLAEIAARVVSEMGGEAVSDSDYPFRENLSFGAAGGDRRENQVGEIGGGDDDFEFAVLCRASDVSAISANEIFYNGQIRPVYPLFDVALLQDNASRVQTGLENSYKKKPPSRRPPLGNLMREEARHLPSLSMSDANDLGAVPSDTYCVWSPNGEKSPPVRGRRNSVGSFNRWKLKDILQSYNRGKSEGENALTMRKMASKNGDQHGNVLKGKEGSKSGIGVACANNSSSGLPSFLAQNARFWRNKAAKEVSKGRSFLPYR